jgi:hypothetical protein
MKIALYLRVSLVEFAFASINGKRLLLGLDPLRISAAYEEKPYQIAGPLHTPSVIVSERSATAISANSATKGFDCDHSTLVKPKDRDDKVYKWVRGRIQLGITQPN